MKDESTSQEYAAQQESEALSEALARSSSPNRGKVNIEIKASFELDDARIFDLNGKGLTIAAVTSN